MKDDGLLFLICYDDDSHWTLDLPGRQAAPCGDRLGRRAP